MSSRVAFSCICTDNLLSDHCLSWNFNSFLALPWKYGILPCSGTFLWVAVGWVYTCTRIFNQKNYHFISRYHISMVQLTVVTLYSLRVCIENKLSAEFPSAWKLWKCILAYLHQDKEHKQKECNQKIWSNCLHVKKFL